MRSGVLCWSSRLCQCSVAEWEGLRGAGPASWPRPVRFSAVRSQTGPSGVLLVSPPAALFLPPADQLRAVMEHVLSFAVRELTKIVEASFDDLLLEITKMETEQQVLEERLGKTPSRGGRGGGAAGGGWRRGPGNEPASPGSSEDTRAELTSTKEEVEREGESSLSLIR